jgi:hypothetical protein
MQAANYLNINNILDLACQAVADMIKGKTPEEIRKTFNIKNDFTPEEEEGVRLEKLWATFNIKSDFTHEEEEVDRLENQWAFE